MFDYLFPRNSLIFRVPARSILALMLLPVVCLIGGLTTHAQQLLNSLDPSFNSNGKVITDLGNPDDIAGAVAVQRDGKIVVAGLTGTINTRTETPGSSDFVVLRYNQNGTLDNTFDGDGKVVTSFGNGEEGASAVLIQPDDKILVAGAINTKTPAGEIGLVRYNADGSLDTTFDGDGKVTTDVAELQNMEERVNAMVLQPDGKIVVVVSSVRDNPLNESVFVVRYNQNGSRDFSFAGDGVTMLPFVFPQGIPQGLTGSDVKIQPDGKIVVAGTVSMADGSDFFVWRINPDGSSDNTFNNRVASVSFNAQDRAVSLFILPDNKILVAGETFNASFRNDFAFARFNSDGTLDTTFNGTGKKVTVCDAAAFMISLDFERQANGKIVSAGVVVSPANPTDSSFAVTRFTEDGNLDTSFDGDGKATTNFGAGGDAAFALAIQGDGKILAAGSMETAPASDNYDIAIARYLGDAIAAQRRTHFDFNGDGRSDFAAFRSLDFTWYIQPSGENNPSAFYGVRWGLETDKLAPADYDGDGKTDVAVWRQSSTQSPDKGYFYILQSSTQTLRVEQFGKEGDLPIAGSDWDGDGKADLAVYRNGAAPNAQSYFFYRPSGTPGADFRTIYWGAHLDVPVAGDYDGDGKTDPAVFRPSDRTWYVLQSSNNQLQASQFGLATDKLIPADYDGDGKTDVAVYRGGTWFLQQSKDGFRAEVFGLPSDKPVPADFTGDGRADVAVYRSGIWYLLNSATRAFQATHFGAESDTAIQTAYLP